MRGAWNRWAVALRIARRSALKSWGRSLLIVLLIALPVAGLASAAVVLPSTQSTLDERIHGTLGNAQALLTPVAGPGDVARQGVEGGYDFQQRDANSASEATVDPRTVLPASMRVLPVRTNGAAVFRTATGAISVSVITGDTWAPALDGGPYQLLSGRRPVRDDEVLLSPAALSRLGAHVGGTLRILGPTPRTLVVVGTSRSRELPAIDQTVFGAADLLPATGIADRYYVPDARIDWATVQRLNRVGTTAFSRAVVLDPPHVRAIDGYSNTSAVLGYGLTIGMALMFALLEVALLAGSAFLVGARLQQRALATVASVGADRAVLRRIITAGGVVLGLVGGFTGLVVGAAGALVFMRVTDDGTWSRYPGLHLWWPLLAAIVVFGVVVGWSAALVPARAAARFDVVQALRGARTPQRLGRKPVVGVVLLLLGIALTLVGAGALPAVNRLDGRQAAPLQIGTAALLGLGPVLAQIGAALCAGLVLRAVTRCLARAPLPVRLAARDTSRNLGRAVPAVAAVMTTVFVAAFAMCIGNSLSTTATETHYWQAPTVGAATISVGGSSPDRVTRADARAVEALVRGALPVDRAAIVATSAFGSGDAHPSGRAADAMAQVHFPAAPGDCTRAQRISAADLRCGAFSANSGLTQNAQPTITIGDEDALRALLGRTPSAAARETLASGGAVALRSDLAPGGTGRLDWFTPKQIDSGASFDAAPVRTTSLRTTVDLPIHPGSTSLFVSASTARRLGIAIGGYSVSASFSRPPTDRELDAANSALAARDNAPGAQDVFIETGPQDFGSALAWLILAVCLLIAVCAGATAIGLARVDGRADDVTLASLGASAGIRKRVAFVQAVVICGTGAVVGSALGLLPAVALGIATESLPFDPPPLQLVLTALGIPVVIAAGAWLLVGTRGADLSRRTAIA